MTIQKGDKIIVVTKRYNQYLKPIFPEHTFSAKVECVIGDFMKICDVELLKTDREKCFEETGRKLSLLARDKLFPSGNYKDNDLYIKYQNNLYFDITIYKQNNALLNDIIEKKWFPSLFKICFYSLKTSELEYLRHNCFLQL